MTVVDIQVMNPTGADVTVDANTVAANDSAVLALDNTTADAWQWLAAGCGLVSNDASSVVQQQEAGWMLYTQATK
jgi:hypothetical protein